MIRLRAASLASVATPPKRLSCATCLRPQRTCICQWITPTPHEVEVVILQHPLEVHSAKGTARLLHLSLPNSKLMTGEVFSPAEVQALLAGPRQAVLLYPETPGESSPPVLSVEQMRNPSQLRLIVLDGTWRKSRKMLYLNPALQGLPRLPLSDLPTSQYLIRKAHLPDQLSTLEATCAALSHLDAQANGSVHADQRFQPLLSAFDGFVAQQMGYAPRSC